MWSRSCAAAPEIIAAAKQPMTAAPRNIRFDFIKHSFLLRWQTVTALTIPARGGGSNVINGPFKFPRKQFQLKQEPFRAEANPKASKCGRFSEPIHEIRNVRRA
jgi:hypothetical protein